MECHPPGRRGTLRDRHGAAAVAARSFIINEKRRPPALKPCARVTSQLTDDGFYFVVRQITDLSIRRDAGPVQRLVLDDIASSGAYTLVHRSNGDLCIIDQWCAQWDRK